MNGYEKFKIFLIYLVTKYLVWLVIGAVIIIWYFFPNLIETIGQIIVFWAPATILLLSLFIALTLNYFKLSREREQGRTQFEIIITGFDFFLVDIIVYGGSILILMVGFVLNPQKVEPVNLIFALIFFVFTNWLKQIFFNKIDK
ncbi:MAG: hypothetical protein NTX82_07400 [Candidatus Parcubacteria bacterium]|nr:hypothetical protein [Candidatus Parcubacteria bacterium]